MPLRAQSSLIILSSAAALCLLPLTACSKDKTRSKNANNANAPATQPVHAPQYVIAPEIRDNHPEVARFLRAFLETCLTGDYEGYRKYVSRRQQPESRERFKRIYDSISLLTVERFDEVEVPTLPKPTYAIVCAVEFVPGKTPVFNEDRREIAILVFREEGEWRMLPAPSKFQPDRRSRATATQPASAPVEDEVDFPWEALDEG
jgi:hypothetical protein